jgi:hypothetical protein
LAGVYIYHLRSTIHDLKNEAFKKNLIGELLDEMDKKLDRIAQK